MSPEQIKNINARCEEYRWLTEREEVINALAYNIACTEETITIDLLFACSLTDSTPTSGTPFEKWKNFILPRQETYKPSTYKAELTDVEALEILGVLLRSVTDKRKALKAFLTENGITF